MQVIGGRRRPPAGCRRRARCCCPDAEPAPTQSLDHHRVDGARSKLCECVGGGGGKCMYEAHLYEVAGASESVRPITEGAKQRRRPAAARQDGP